MDRTKKTIAVAELGSDKNRETAAMIAELEGGHDAGWPLRFQSRGDDTKKAGRRR